jgi:ceramide glucosyltransferase
MVTFAYVVREIPSPPTLPGALFVNADFYPGVVLLRGRGAVDFGLGAAMLFRRDDFLGRIDWRELGAELADDFFLGQKLGPVRVGAVTLETRVDASGWAEALRHDLRWTRTIFWNRPGGSAARIVILPVLGWMGWAILHPLQPWGWLGLLGMMQIDVLFAALICRRIGCRLGWSDLPVLEGWSLWRGLLWVLGWLPLPVVWSGKRWRRASNLGSRISSSL